MNFATQRYVIDDDGNPAQMPSTRQRVFMALAMNAGDPPKYISDTTLTRREEQLRAALAELVSEGAIRINSVSVEEQVGGMSETVSYTDLQTGIDDTITR
jgi:hypothetical protein